MGGKRDCCYPGLVRLMNSETRSTNHRHPIARIFAGWQILIDPWFGTQLFGQVLLFSDSNAFVVIMVDRGLRNTCLSALVLVRP
jgi:hypothetical protein